jgi:hypothetical protein
MERRGFKKMKHSILSALILFPGIKYSAIDPCDVKVPTESHLFQDSLPPAVFYFLGGGGVMFAAAAAYMKLK